MGTGNRIREVSWLDCAGSGQVVVDGHYAYIAHMDAPHGTTIVDVKDPANPRIVAELSVPVGMHSHKVRVANDIMIVNQEAFKGRPPEGDLLGLKIYDVRDPRKPVEIAMWSCAGIGVHRFTFDGRYAYISPEIEGYVGNIVMILDFIDPARPVEVGRWWMPGQWVAGGEVPSWEGRAHRCHHPIRHGNRLYVSYWYGGAVVLDITDMSAPRWISTFDSSPPFAWPTHTVLPVGKPIHGHNWMLVADEHMAPLHPEMSPEMPAFLWMLDVTAEARPVPVGTFQVAGLDGRPQPLATGCHQIFESVPGTEVYAAWFAQGLRIIDISNPHQLSEVASYVPDVPAGADRVKTNDVFVDPNGLIYLVDRTRGLSIVERQ